MSASSKKGIIETNPNGTYLSDKQLKILKKAEEVTNLL